MLDEKNVLKSIACQCGDLSSDKAMEYIYEITRRFIVGHYSQNKSIPKDCLNDMIQDIVIKLYENDLKKYNPERGEFLPYLYACIENTAKKCRFVNDSLGEKEYSKRLRSKIHNDYYNNHLSIKDIMEKYNIKKKSTVDYYLKWDGQVYSLDFADEDGNNLYNRVSVEEVDESEGIEDGLKRRGFCDEKSLYILTIYLQQVKKLGVKRGAQKRTIEICQSESLLTKKEIVDVIHRYNN